MLTKCFLKFADEFENRFVKQGSNENRSIEETLTLAGNLWRCCPGLSQRVSQKISISTCPG